MLTIQQRLAARAEEEIKATSLDSPDQIRLAIAENETERKSSKRPYSNISSLLFNLSDLEDHDLKKMAGKKAKSICAIANNFIAVTYDVGEKYSILIWDVTKHCFVAIVNDVYGKSVLASDSNGYFAIATNETLNVYDLSSFLVTEPKSKGDHSLIELQPIINMAKLSPHVPTSMIFLSPKEIVIADENGTVNLWDLSEMRPKKFKEWARFEPILTKINENKFMSCGIEKAKTAGETFIPFRIQGWNVDDCQNIDLFPLIINDAISQKLLLALFKENQILILNEGEISCIDLDKKSKSLMISNKKNYNVMLTIPDTSLLVTGSFIPWEHNAEITIWDLANNSPKRLDVVKLDQIGIVTDLVFNSDLTISFLQNGQVKFFEHEIIKKYFRQRYDTEYKQVKSSIDQAVLKNETSSLLTRDTMGIVTEYLIGDRESLYAKTKLRKEDSIDHDSEIFDKRLKL